MRSKKIRLANIASNVTLRRKMCFDLALINVTREECSLWMSWLFIYTRVRVTGLGTPQVW